MYSFALGGLDVLGLCAWNLWRLFSPSGHPRSRALGQLCGRPLSEKYGDWTSRLTFVKLGVLIFVIGMVLFGTAGIEVVLWHYEVSTTTASFGSTSQLMPFLGGLLNLLYAFCCGFQKGLATWPATCWCHQANLALNCLLRWDKVSFKEMYLRMPRQRAYGSKTSNSNMSTT